jgi:tripartite-type tricarboxylate transporter receptor subunit TctC
MKRTAAVVAVVGVLAVVAGCSSSHTATANDNAAVFPEKGKVITMIVPYGVGGGTDVGARVLAQDLEPILGTTVKVVDEEGASGEIGLTNLVRSQPDGYTIAWANTPITSPIYENPANKAPFTSADLLPIANYVFDAGSMIVPKNSPYHTLGELVDAAKAHPGTITISASASLAPGDDLIRSLELATGAKFQTVYFPDQGEQRAALLGGHVDVEAGSVSEQAGAVQAGQVNGLAVFDTSESPFMPGVKTAAEQGFNIENGSSRLLVAPKGTPTSVINTLSAAVKEALNKENSDRALKKVDLVARYLDPAATGAYIKTIDAQVKTFLAQIANQSK